MEWITSNLIDFSLLPYGSGIQVDVGLPILAIVGTILVIKFSAFLPRRKKA